MALIATLPADHREIIRERYVLAVDLGRAALCRIIGIIATCIRMEA
jgi:hypothetical protein